MSEFDVNLISAFAKCPAFYDKSNPNFKDRTFTENAWKEISLQLGFDEKVLRDRMFQLRNRYNLEKRKVEMQDGDPNAKSTWPLFDRMSFLEGHIRPRKSYKSIMSRSLENDQYANNAMFFNQRNSQQMRSYPQHHHHLMPQNVHNARLQQLANHIQMMANNNEDPQIDLSGDAFSAVPNNLMTDMFEGDDRGGAANPLHLFQQQQQQQQQLSLQQQLQFQQQQQQQQQNKRQRRDGGGDSSSETKQEFYSESEDDEDGLRDTETDTTSKSKDEVTTFGSRMTDVTSQALGELLSNVTEDTATATARNEVPLRNGSAGEPSQSTMNCGESGNDDEDTFINPMDILITRQTTGSQNTGNGIGSHSSNNMRYLDTVKRKGDSSQSGGLEQRSYLNSHAGPNGAYKRRRRNYQNMVPNGMTIPDNGMKLNMLSGGTQGLMSANALNGSNSLLGNPGLLLSQLQNNLMNQHTFLHPTPSPSIMVGCTNSNTTPPDKFTSFGQFLASSLSELKGLMAMELMAKFTTEVTNALREQKEGPVRAKAPMQEDQTNSHDLRNQNNSTASNSSSIHDSGEDKYRSHQF